ncbi:MAG: DUF3572 domain-containing protein [Pseudomonadota bacterium]
MKSSEFAPLGRDRAELLALQALGWIAGQDDLSGTFLTATGAGADDLRTRAGDPEFLGFVLDFLLGDEQALLAFCDEAQLKPDQPMRARAALPGGDLPNWT